ncbi:MAG TPA: DinB family protein [Symbiobacteriaceae bacterium]
MPYTIYIDGTGKKGPWMGHLLSEPGCIWLASSPIAVTASAPDSIARYYAWLRTHGEADVLPVTPEEVEVDVAEIHEVEGFGQSGAPVGLFEPDSEPVTDADIARVIRRLIYARGNLLEAVAELPSRALDWQPPNGKRTLRQNLEHIRAAQGYYLTRVYGWDAANEILPDPWPDETMASFNWVLNRSVWALLNLPESLRSGIYQAEGPAEEWTPRKMLRRFVEHEMEHLGVVRVTIGVWRQAREEVHS